MLKLIAYLCGFFALLASLAGVVYRTSQTDLSQSMSPSGSLLQFLSFEQALPLIVHNYSIALMALLVLSAIPIAMTHSVLRVRALLGYIVYALLLLLPLGIDLSFGQLLSPAIKSALHFSLGGLFIACAYALALHLAPNVIRVKSCSVGYLAKLAVLCVLVLQFSGIWVSTNAAGQACSDLAPCIAAWLTTLDLRMLLQALLAVFNGQMPVITSEHLSGIMLWHVALACIIAFGLFAVAILALLPRQVLEIRKAGLVLLVMLVMEITLGMASLQMQHPVWITWLHSGLGLLLLLPVLAMSFYSSYAVYVPDATKEIAAANAVTALTAASAKADYVEPEPESIYLRLKSQLKRTRSGIGNVLSAIPFGQRAINSELLEDIEASLIMADVGMEATTAIIQKLTDKLERQQLNDVQTLSAALKQELLLLLQPCSRPLVIPKQDKPYVILVVGINGAGKTTTIGKMAKRLQAQGHSVMLAAGDTFRAAAVEQLQVWGERNNIQVVAQHTGADSASVIFDAVQSASAKGIDVLIADTAGRLHTKSNLMDELKKVKRIMGRLDESAPHEVLLVLDAGTGQNALSQAKLFNEAVALTGLVLTKLDGTAKGGVIFALARQMEIPIRYIGVGEAIDDLQDFDAERFVDALFVLDE